MNSWFGLIFLIVFLILVLGIAAIDRRRSHRTTKAAGLRNIPAFARLERAVGLAVESGTRLHVSLGHGGINGLEGGAALVGLSVLQRIARAASISDRPPVATSGEGVIGILSQDTLRNAYILLGSSERYDPQLGQVSGLTPFSYATGALALLQDQQVSANVLAGRFGPEVALITDASEQKGILTLSGSDNLPAQAVLYATSEETLIGEDFFAASAYLQAGPLHLASLRAQDILRWILIFIILVGTALKLLGVL